MKSNLGVRIALVASLMWLSMDTFAAEYIVKYRNGFSVNEISGQAMQIKSQHIAGSYYVVDIQDSAKADLVSKLSQNSNIEYVVPNAQIHAFENREVSAREPKAQWAIDKVEAVKAWDRAGNKGSRKVVVAVIDTGADYKHESLAPNMVQGFDFIKNSNDPMDVVGQQPGHGTHCSGIVGATGLIEGGTLGLSPEVSIMPLRFLDQNGSGNLDNGVKAIDYAVEKHVDVISASWGAAISHANAMPLIEAIGRAEKAGIVFVVAAANDGKNNDSYEVYPANAGLSNTISVAASNSKDAKPSWSNYGKAKVNLSSPGDAIISTLPNAKYGKLSGTSMATPLVAGLVALIKAQDENLTPLQIRSLLQASADKVSISTACDCRVNAYGAIDQVIAKKMFISPFAATLATGKSTQFEAVYGKAPFRFSSSNPQVGSIDANGVFQAKAKGTTSITVSDASGASSTSYNIYVN